MRIPPLLRSRIVLPLAYLVSGIAWVVGSDAVLGEATQLSLLAQVAGSLKGIAFVAVSAALLFAVQAWPTGESAAAAALPARSPARPLLIFLITAVGIAVAGVVLYRQQAEEVRRTASVTLSRTAEFTARQLERWVEAHRSGLGYAASNPLLADAVRATLDGRDDAAAAARLATAVELLRQGEEFTGVALFSADGSTVAAVGSPIELTPVLRRRAAAAAATGRVVMSDLYEPTHDAGAQPVLDFVASLRDAGGAAHILVARAEPSFYLHDVLDQADDQDAPVALSLARREGAGAVLVLTSRPGAEAPRALDYLPLAQGAAAAQVIAGRRGVFEAPDYRGVPVLATGRAIEGTSWFLVAKTERAAVFAPLRDLAALAGLLSLGGLVASALLVMLWWRSERYALAARVEAAERRATVLKEHFAVAGRLVNDLVLLIDARDGRVLDANDRALEAYGYAREEMLERTVFDLRPPDDAGRARARHRFAALLGRGSGTFVVEHLRRDGQPITLDVSARTCEFEGRRYIQAIGRDIGERLEQERRVAAVAAERDRLLERYRQLIEVSPAGIFRTDARGHTVYMSPRAATIVGMPLAECLGLGWTRAIHPDDAPWVGRQWQDYIASGGSTPYAPEARLVQADGGVRWVLAQISPEHDASGTIVGHIGTITDVTALKTAQVALRQARDHLEERVAERTRELEAAKNVAEHSDRVKSAFLSTMSHELRTPLNSILGFTDVILQGLSGPLTEPQRRQLEIVRESSAHLRALIEDVLDISRIEAGQVGLEFAPVDLHELVARRVESFGAEAARKRLALEFEAGDAVPVVRTDGKRVGQIVNNLLSNAIKFTEHGGVRTTLRLVGDDVELAVVDTGIGIPPDALVTLFNPFTQVTRPGGRLHEGTGLGLAISRNLARALGGDVTVRSDLDRGSTFTLRLPLAGPVEAHPERAPGPAVRPGAVAGVAG
jgi:PAS domain S-box-containing protein